MLQDFNYKNTLEDIREAKRIEQEYEKIKKELDKTFLSNAAKKAKRDILEEEKSNALVVKEKTNILSKLASIFHKGKYYKVNQQIAEKEEELRNVQEECRKLGEKEKALKVDYENVLRLKEAKKMTKCMLEENGKLVITDGDTGLGGYSIKGKDSGNPIPTNPKQKVLVHCTDFFPRNNWILSDYDGGKIMSEQRDYHGVYKKVKALQRRREIHCTINNRVESTTDAAGNWDNPTYIIIDRYDIHEKELEHINSSDTWTKGTSMQLSNDAVIMVKLQDKDKLPIPKEEMEQYNIIYYDGNPTTCLRNFLRLNGYDIFHTERNDPSHAHSPRGDQEKGLYERDLAINFMKDNTFFSKEPPIFLTEDIAQIVDICKSRMSILGPEQDRLCMRDRDIPERDREVFYKIASFVVGSGIKRTGDGRYTFKRDEEILENIEDVYKDRRTLPNSVDVDLIHEVFDMQQRLVKQQVNASHFSIEQIKSMSLQELYKFKNQSACEMVQAALPKETNMIGDGNHIIFQIYVADCLPIIEKLKAEDGIYFNGCMLEKVYDGAITVAEITSFFDNFRKQLEEIKEREDYQIVYD